MKKQCQTTQCLFDFLLDYYRSFKNKSYHLTGSYKRAFLFLSSERKKIRIVSIACFSFMKSESFRCRYSHGLGRPCTVPKSFRFYLPPVFCKKIEKQNQCCENIISHTQVIFGSQSVIVVCLLLSCRRLVVRLFLFSFLEEGEKRTSKSINKEKVCIR